MNNNRVDREMRAVRRLMQENKDHAKKTDRIAMAMLVATVVSVTIVIFLWWVGVLR